MTRGRKTAVNTMMGFAEEIVAVICGFILPRLILRTFGSAYNGLSSSITQFLSCAVLLRSGIGGVTRAALYKPLADNDIQERDSIIKATDLYMKKIALILAALIIVLGAIYPFFVSDEFDWFFTFTLFIIIGSSTFAESYFGVTYRILLQADQRLWVTSLFQIACYILNTLISVVLIYAGCSIHIVKLGSAFVYVLYPILQSYYVKRHYHINLKAKPDNSAISQRWDAFWQQAATFVMTNTDIIVLTIFSSLLEVSVYSVYNLVTNGLRRAVNALTNGLEAPFGNMIAKGETDSIQSNLRVLELLIHAFCTVVFVSAALLVLSFISIYTSGINDVNYIRPAFAYIIMLAQFFNGIRMPYQCVVQAAGHYKETRNGAIIEPILNITLSIILVINYGLVGVAIGTLVAIIFRTIQYSYHVSKYIVLRSQLISIGHIVVSAIEAIIIILLINFVIPQSTPTTYIQWIGNAFVVVIVSCIVVMLGSVIFYYNDTKLSLKKIKRIL